MKYIFLDKNMYGEKHAYFFIFFLLISLAVFSQTIPSTGSSATTCGNCTPSGWIDVGGTPDISNKDNSGGQGSAGGGSTWVNAPLPIPPTGDITWISMRDLGANVADESVNTTMNGLVSGKIYVLTIYTMTSISNTDGESSINYSGTYKSIYDYQIGSNPAQEVTNIGQDVWTKTQVYFLADASSMTFRIILGQRSGYLGDGNNRNLIESLHLAVELNALEVLDTDNDGIEDTVDLDNDNDGILDSVESTIGGTTYNPYGDEDGDLLPNYLDTNDNNGTSDGSTTSYTDSNNDGVADIFDTDLDGIPNHLDLDSDGDGIPDNIEAQTTAGYIAPSGSGMAMVDANNNGVDDNYETSQGGTDISPVNSDSATVTDNPDYLDTDSDQDGVSDTTEANLTLSGIVGVNGLDNTYDNGDNYSDVNGSFDNTQTDNFPDDGNNASSGLPNDVDWRDINITGELDTDGDGVPNSVDIDDDNDGILDTDEGAGDLDGDGIPNSLDLDSDNDGIPDNIEGQSTTGYIVPTGGVGANGLYDVYENNDTTSATSFTIVNTDGTDTPDYLDTDSDNDGTNDQTEANLSLSGNVGINGLDNNYDNGDNYSDVNGSFDNTQTDNFPDADNDVNGAGDVDYRDSDSVFIDNDNDGVPDNVDLDDDNDGILDTEEICNGETGLNTSTISITIDLGTYPEEDSFTLTGPNSFSESEGAFSSATQDVVTYTYSVSSSGTYVFTLSDTANDGLDNTGGGSTNENGLSSYRVELDGVLVFQSANEPSFGTGGSAAIVNVNVTLPRTGGYLCLTADPALDSDNDGIVNYKDPDYAAENGSSIVNGVIARLDFDGDGIPDYLDLDSDNDGIPDNIEAQTTTGYILPNGVVDANGVDTAYTGGLTPINTDGTDNVDYLDTDSDNDGILDNTEAGVTLTGNVGTNGLDNAYDNGDNYTDVNGSFDNSQGDNFPDADGDVFNGGDVDYRDDTFTTDNDGDGINDEVDLDDDNDGIVDATEYGSCSSPGSPNYVWETLYAGNPNSTTVTDGDDPIVVDNNKEVNNVTVTLSRTSNVFSDSNYRVNDANGITSSSYTLNQQASINALSRHIFDFSAPIYNLGFTVYDVDQDTGNATDEIEIILTKEDGTTYSLTGSDYAAGGTTVNSNTFTGTGGSTNVTINPIAQWIVKLQVVYKNVGSGSINDNQVVGIGDLSYCTPLDSDGDGVFDFRDLDADNDGIPDNIEAQTTTGYIAPTGSYSITGIDLAYGTGLTPVNTDGTDNPDYLDLDSDNQGGNDTTEANLTGSLTGTYGANGLDDGLETGDTDNGYTDVNGEFDNTQTDNFPDGDNDVNTASGDVDWRDDLVGLDTDGDGVLDTVDVDDDNDGILDITESGGFNPDGDEDGDGTPNYQDNSDATPGNGDQGQTNYTDTNMDGIPDVYDSDNDGVPNHLDIDADNDGIPDNVEAQTTLGYIAPSGTGNGITDNNNNGLDDNYESGQGGTDLSPIDTDTLLGNNGDGIPDYLDSDSDGDGTLDIQENGDSDNTISGTDTDGDGLDDNFEGSNTNDGYDINDEINTPSIDLPDVDSDVNGAGDVDYRDQTEDPVTPGVVGNTLWLRADIGVTGGSTVTLWEDQTASNADFTGSGTPNNTVAANNLNFNPVVTFVSGDADYLSYAGNLNPRSVYIVYNDTSTAQWITPFTNNDGHGIGHGETNDSGLFNDGSNGDNGGNGWTPVEVRNGSGQINGLSTTLTTHNRPDSYELISNVYTSNISDAIFTYSVARDRTQARYLDGNIAEIMIFSDEHTGVQRQQIESYLAIKYGFTLSNDTDNNASANEVVAGSINEGDYVLADQTTKVWDSENTYHNDVAGIGRDDAMVLNQKQSKSVNSDAIITIGLNAIAATNLGNANTFTSNKDFLMWGNNNGVINTVTETELICAPEKTLGRTWKIVENGSVGLVQIAANKTIIDGALTTPNTIKVLKVADDAAFTTNVSYTPLTDTTINSENVYATNFDFNGTKYFTYSEINGIFWTGDNNSWAGGNSSTITGAPSTNVADRDKVMVIDAQSGTNATMLESGIVECVWVKAGSKLMVASDSYLEFDEDFILDGEVRLIGDAQLIQTHTGDSNVQGSGRLFKDQASEIPNTYRYNYWSSPVVELNKSTFEVRNVMKDGTIPTSENSEIVDINFTSSTYNGSPGTPITIANYWIWTFFNETVRDDWVQKRDNTPIARGLGYTMKSTGANPQNFTFVGTPNDGSIVFNFSPNTTSLLGNPYPSNLDVSNFITTNSNAIDGTLYFWEHRGEEVLDNWAEGHGKYQYEGGYSQRNISMGIAANTIVEGTIGLGTAPEGYYAAPPRYAAVGQGFFVSSSATGGTVRFENSQRTYNANTIFFKSANSNEDELELLPVLKLGFEYNNANQLPIHRQLGISFKRGNSFAYDNGFDSELFDLRPNDAYWKFPKEERKLIIAGVQELSEQIEVPITIEIGMNTPSFIMIDERKNISQKIYLYDKLENKYFDLDNSVELDLEIGTYSKGFYIVFRNQTLSTNEEQILSSEMQIFTDNSTDEIVIKNHKNIAIKKVALYNLLGQEIKTWKNLEGIENRLNIKSISNSVYIVKLDTEKGNVSKKVVFK